MKKLWLSCLIFLAIGMLLAFSAAHPFVEPDSALPESVRTAVQEQAAGLYSSRLPLVPVYVRIDSYAADRVFYTIYYFPFGSVGMSFQENDGYNMEKPLTGLQ